MYEILSNMSHKFMVDVGKYSILGASEVGMKVCW